MDITSGRREGFTQSLTGWHVLDQEDYHKMGRNFKRKVYDRLRKRSYRRQGFYAYGRIQHEAYVAGVRDALKAMPDG